MIRSELHRHCESCHNRRCKFPIEISVSCMIINCRLLCGASFHMCKEDEHTLLCPNEKVPCINAHYGCPSTMCRSNLAKHLEVCPASVVVCSVAWNRRPIEESEPPEFYKNILKENYTQEPLDLSMALRDQRHLFHSLKMKAILPELIEMIKEELGGAVGGVSEVCDVCLYTHLDPMKIKVVASRLMRRLSHFRKNSKADTPDLGNEMDDMPTWDDVQATLIYFLEKEWEGYYAFISEFIIVPVRSFLKDQETCIFDFSSAPFNADVSLADLRDHSALHLHVQTQSESITNKYNKCSYAFTYQCSHSYRRDEFCSHYKNFHSDIQFCLNGWFEHRCPLAYLGCTFSQRQFRPRTHKAIVSYDKHLSTFTLRPEVPSILYEGGPAFTAERKHAWNQHVLSKLPFEALFHIAGFLDSYTLSQLALVSRLMREVCRILLQERGMVSLKWEKKIFAHGEWWRVKHKVWEYSNMFSPVDNWCWDNIPSMSEHLKVCPYYEKENKIGWHMSYKKMND